MGDLGGGESLEKVQAIKDFFHQHRMVPSSVAWPAGLNYTGGIEYDCASGTFLEADNAYDFSQLGPKYIDGDGWNGVGFPSFQIMQFVDNSTPRPQEFCGVDRGPDHFGTAAYNAEWSRFVADKIRRRDAIPETVAGEAHFRSRCARRCEIRTRVADHHRRAVVAALLQGG